MSVETPEFLGMVRRMLRAAGKRVADADEEELRQLVAMREELDIAITAAVQGQNARGVSWAKIGEATGMARQSAHARWGSNSRAYGLTG